MLEKSSSGEPRTNVPWAVPIGIPPKDRAGSDGADNSAAPADEAAVEKANRPEPDAIEPESVQEDAPGSVAPTSASDGAAPDTSASPDPDYECDDAVIRALMDVLIAPDGMVQPQERAFAVDLLLQAVDYASDAAKHLLCDRLANMPEAPASLISRFLNDPDLKIAEPLLLRASCVTDAELISVVESGDRQRSEMVARRRHMSSAVSTAIARTHDRDLALALVRNPCAVLSREAVEQLCDMAVEHQELVESLVARPEMTTACALRLFWDMPANERAYVLGRFLAEVQVLPQIIVMSKPGVDLVAAALGSSARSREDSKDASGKQGKRHASDLVAALTEVDSERLENLIAECGHVERTVAARIVDDGGGEPLVVACKALGVSRFAFADALQEWHSAHGLSTGQEPLQILFDTLSFRQARMALTYWNWQSRSIGPYKAAL